MLNFSVQWLNCKMVGEVGGRREDQFVTIQTKLYLLFQKGKHFILLQPGIRLQFTNYIGPEHKSYVFRRVHRKSFAWSHRMVLFYLF